MKINIEFELEEINHTGKMSESELKEELIDYIDSLFIHDRFSGDDTSVLWTQDTEGYVHTFKISITNGKD
jgi:hypothetical protein